MIKIHIYLEIRGISYDMLAEYSTDATAAVRSSPELSKLQNQHELFSNEMSMEDVRECM